MKPVNNNHKVFIITACVSCKPNSILSSRLVRYFKDNDWQIAGNMKEADSIVVNTCAYCRIFEKKSMRIISDALRSKKNGAKVISAGCFNRIDRKLLEDNFPDIHIVDGFDGLKDLFGFDNQVNNSQYYDEDMLKCVVDSWDKFYLKQLINPFFWMIGMMRQLSLMVCRCFTGRRNYAHIKQIADEVHYVNKQYVQISTGCLGECSYCVIKRAKGDVVSRPIRDIIADIKAIYDKDKVLCLVADDCGSYGVDCGESIFTLVEAINDSFPGISLDIPYINPLWIEKYPDRYVEMVKRFNINSINISLQSGSDRIVGLMNRRYKAGNILAVVDKVKRVSASTLIWSDYLVNFPSETWKEFFLTFKSCGHFDYYRVFIHSPRKGTKSAAMKPQNAAYLGTLRWALLVARQFATVIKRLFISRGRIK